MKPIVVLSFSKAVSAILRRELNEGDLGKKAVYFFSSGREWVLDYPAVSVARAWRQKSGEALWQDEGFVINAIEIVRSEVRAAEADERVVWYQHDAPLGLVAGAVGSEAFVDGLIDTLNKLNNALVKAGLNPILEKCSKDRAKVNGLLSLCLLGKEKFVEVAVKRMNIVNEPGGGQHFNVRTIPSTFGPPD